MTTWNSNFHNNKWSELENFYQLSNNNMQKYSFWIGFKKAFVQVILFGLPLLAQILPEAWMNLTLGGVLTLVVNYIKVSVNNLEVK